MTDVLLVYVTCTDENQAKNIGKVLLKKKLCACIKVISHSYAAFFWPPKSDKLTEETEAVLLIKTHKVKFSAIEKEITMIHSDQTPCILGIPIAFVNQNYLEWLNGEIDV